MKNLVTILLFNITFSLSCNATWRIIDENRYPPDTNFTYEMRYEAVDCANNKDCIAIGNMMLKMPWNRVTEDAGIHWKTTLADSILSFYPISIFDVSYPDTNLCIIVGDSNSFWRSTDRCKTWKKSNFNGTYKTNQVKIFRVKMYNSNLGGIITPWEFFLTNDGGLNWTKTEIKLVDSLKPITIYDISITDSTSIILLCYRKSRGTYLIKTSDLGVNWIALDTLPKPIEKVSFINGLEGWGCGGQQVSYGSMNFKNIITHTIDGGKTWEVQLDSMPYKRYGLQQIQFIDNLNGYALGVGYNLWKTSNGGKNWALDLSYNYPDKFVALRNFYFFKNKDIIGVTDDALIYKFEFETFVENEKNFQNDREIFPNPATDFIEIICRGEVTSLLQSDVKIFNLFGQCVNLTLSLSILGEGEYKKAPTLSTSGEGVRIDVSGLARGMYFVRVGDRVSKFIKL